MQIELETRLKMALEILAEQVDVLSQEEVDEVMFKMNLPFTITLNPDHR